MAIYQGGPLRGWAGPLAEGQKNVPVAQPLQQGQEETLDQDRELAGTKVGERAAKWKAERLEEAERRKQEQEQAQQQQDQLRLEEEDRARAARKQQEELQRQAEEASEQALQDLRETEARAQAPQGSTPNPRSGPVAPAETIPEESPSPTVAPEASIPSSEETIEEELAPTSSGNAVPEPVLDKAAEEISPLPRTAAPRAKTARTPANPNASANDTVDAAPKGRAATSTPAVDARKGSVAPPSYAYYPATPAEAKGKLPKTPISSRAPDVSGEAGRVEGPPTSSIRALAPSLARGSIGRTGGRKIAGLPVAHITEFQTRLEAHEQKEKQRKISQIRLPLSGQFLPGQPVLEETWEKLRAEHEKPRNPDRKRLYGISELPRMKPSSPPRPPTRPPKGRDQKLKRIELVKEGKQEGTDFYTYQAGAEGHEADFVPRLSATDGKVVVTAKFDARKNLILIDRKLSLSTGSVTRWLMLRQSLVAGANGFTVRWEVPDAKQARKVEQIIAKLGLNNVDVAICK